LTKCLMLRQFQHYSIFLMAFYELYNLV